MRVTLVAMEAEQKPEGLAMPEMPELMAVRKLEGLALPVTLAARRQTISLPRSTGVENTWFSR